MGITCSAGDHNHHRKHIFNLILIHTMYFIGIGVVIGQWQYKQLCTVYGMLANMVKVASKPNRCINQALASAKGNRDELAGAFNLKSGELIKVEIKS